MKILVTSIVDLNWSEPNRCHQFVKYLSGRHQVTVLSIKDWWKAEQGISNTAINDFDEIFKKVEYNYVTKRKISPYLQEILATYLVRKFIQNDYDIHLNYSTIFSGYPATEKINTIYDIADDLVGMIKCSPQIFSLLRPIGGAMGEWMVQRNIDSSRFVTVTTPYLINRYGIPANKSKVIPNGVDLELFRYLGPEKRGLMGLDGFVIGFVGALREWVNLEPVLEALQRLDEEIKLLVVGKGLQQEKCIVMAEKYGLKNRILLTGTVPYKDVAAYISAMDVCLVPFKKFTVSEYALPLKLFEYMACQRPVISTELLAVKDAVDNNVLYANTSKDYEEKILQLYNNESLREEMGKRGRKLVESRYKWSKIVKELENMLIKFAE